MQGGKIISDVTFLIFYPYGISYSTFMLQFVDYEKATYFEEKNSVSDDVIE